MEKKLQNNSLSVGFVALGCPKNMVDSEVMLAQIGQDGFVLSPDPDNADVVVINTCGFIAPAKEEAMNAIRHTTVAISIWKPWTRTRTISRVRARPMTTRA